MLYIGKDDFIDSISTAKLGTGECVNKQGCFLSVKKVWKVMKCCFIKSSVISSEYSNY